VSAKPAKAPTVVTSVAARRVEEIRLTTAAIPAGKLAEASAIPGTTTAWAMLERVRMAATSVADRRGEATFLTAMGGTAEARAAGPTATGGKK
jgi:predicted secreted protein